MNIKEFDFILPKHLIAQKTVSPRSNSRLLIVKNGFKFIDTKFREILSYIEQRDLIVVNDSKVLPVRLLGHIDDKKVLVTLHLKKEDSRWLAFAKPGKICRINKEIIFSDSIRGIIIGREKYELDIEFNCSNRILEKHMMDSGIMPLPPYIKRKEIDRDDYRDYLTIFSKIPGSVAAPTAGLHFDKNLISRMKSKNINIASITLHVGAGTYLPIRKTDFMKHKLHREEGFVSNSTMDRIKQTKDNGGKIIAIGTTVLRLLESAFIVNNGLNTFNGYTDLFIYPGFKFKVVDKLVTNFHLPKSTLFLLVSAFAGKKVIMNAYKDAMDKKYRFYSYGDAMMISRK